MNPVWKLNFFLFNIEGYGEFFSGITPTCIALLGIQQYRLIIYLKSEDYFFSLPTPSPIWKHRGVELGASFAAELYSSSEKDKHWFRCSKNQDIFKSVHAMLTIYYGPHTLDPK